MHQPWPESDQEPLPPPGADHLTLVRWMASLPCNRSGSDKTWVAELDQRLLRDVRHRALARRLHEEGALSMHQDLLDRIVDEGSA